MKTSDDYLNPILVSVIIPTRNRVEQLRRSVKSVFDCSKNPAQVEVVIRVASDDKATIDALSELIASFPAVRAVISWQFEPGVDCIAQYNDEAVRLARGKFLQMFCDDAWIEGRNWEERFETADPEKFIHFVPEWTGNGPSHYHKTEIPFAAFPTQFWFKCGLAQVHGSAVDAVIAGNPLKQGVDFLPGVLFQHYRDESEMKARDNAIRDSRQPK